MKLSDKQKRTFLKCAEELNELSVELLQAVNKPNQDNKNQIHNEITDVKKWLNKLFQNTDD
jgi:hypothetical protein